MKNWIQARKKQVIIAVLTAALAAAIPQLPPTITGPLINVVYALFEDAPETISPPVVSTEPGK